MSITNEITAIIKQNLPAAVADELGSFISQAQEDSIKLKECEFLLVELGEQIIQLEKQVEDLQSRETQLSEIIKREKDVSERENKLEVTLSKNEAEQAKLRAGDIKELASIVFRNRSLIHREEIVTPVKDQYGKAISHYGSKTTTRTED